MDVVVPRFVLPDGLEALRGRSGELLEGSLQGAEPVVSLGGAAARAVDHGRVVGRGDRSGAGPIRERARLAPEQKIELLVRVRRELVRVEVSDDGEGFDTVAVPPHPDHAAGGWGLWIVAQLTDRWGIDVSRSTRIWVRTRNSRRTGARRRRQPNEGRAHAPSGSSWWRHRVVVWR